MSPKNEGRTEACDKKHARVRLAHAEKFYEVAELVESEATEDGAPASTSVAAALAILAGIAASDAACCLILGRRSRNQDHQQAQNLLKQINPGGGEAAKQLGALILLKDAAHYGVINVSMKELKIVMRRAQSLVEFAKAIRQSQ